MFGLEKLAGSLKRAFGAAAPRGRGHHGYMGMDQFYAAAVAEDAAYHLAQKDPAKKVFAGADLNLFVQEQITHRADLFGGIKVPGGHMQASNLLTQDMADFEDRTGNAFPSTIKESLAQMIERDGFTAPLFLQEGRVHKGKGGAVAPTLRRGLN